MIDIDQRIFQWAAMGLLIYVISKVICRYVRKKKLHVALDTKIEYALKQRQDSIEWAKRVSSAMSGVTRQEIVRKTFSQLQECLQSGSLSAEFVLIAYIGAALEAHEETNCIVLFLKESIDEARELDKNAQNSSYKKSPLFGIPLSVKETPGVRGSTFTFGGAARLTGPRNDDDPFFVKAARENGAVPFVLTNTPLSCMTYTTISPVYGTTTHPLRKDRTSGGSTGGEGALIGSGGSILGLGGDIGGSIRIPAAYCGFAGFKPAAHRMSLLHYGKTLPGRPFLWPADGPMARSMDACAQVLRITWQNNRVNMIDPFKPPVNFREELFEKGRKYKIGYFTSSEFITVLPAMEKAVLKAKDILEGEGHELVPFDPPGMDKLVKFKLGLYAMDGLEYHSRVLNTDRIPQEFKLHARFTTFPLWLKKLMGFSAKLVGDRIIAEKWSHFPTTGADVQALIHEYYIFRCTFVEAMQAQGIDAILSCPVPSPALKIATPINLGPGSSMLTGLYNLLDFGAGVVKVSEWTDQDDKDLEGYRPKDEFERTIKEESKVVQKKCRECLESNGLPIAVQVASPPYRDEIALRILCDLEEALQKKQ